MKKSANMKMLVVAGLLGLAAWQGQSPVLAQAGADQVRWILTGESPLLDRSTTYLANGYTEAGIGKAKSALERSGSELKDVIANHNLCIAYRSLGEEGQAEPFCQQVMAMEIPALGLYRLKAGMYKVSRRGRNVDAVRLDDVVARNLVPADHKFAVQQGWLSVP